MLPKFETHEDSHEHSALTLDLLNGYDDFMSSIDTVVDMGCGKGLDTFWWATRRDPQPPHVPRNYNCIAIDKDFKKVKPELHDLKNVRLQQEDFENPSLDDTSVDIIWCHNSFQYAKSPLQTLKRWHTALNTNGMIYMCLPYNVNRHYNKFSGKTESGVFYHYMPSNIINLLCVSGFDCSDARFYKIPGDNFFHICAYKDEDKDINEDSSWYEIAESGRLPKSAVKFINKTGYLDDYHLEGLWFNGSRYTFDKQ